MKTLSTSPGLTFEPCHKAAFLDRDGVINVDHGYVSRWEDFEFLPGAIEGMRLLQDDGYKLIVVTNQSGIARGYFDKSDYQKLTATYSDYLSKHGVVLSGIYHCPHHPDYPTPGQSTPCNCRKPKPGLIQKASLDHNIQLRKSILIGDSSSDLEAAYYAGIERRFLLASKQANLSLLQKELSYSVCTSLHDCAMGIHLSTAAQRSNAD